MAINVVWCITTLIHLITVHVYYNNMSNQLYIENKGKDIQLKRGGGGGVDYFKVMTNNASSFLTICFATFYNCKCEGGGWWWWWWKKSF